MAKKVVDVELEDGTRIEFVDGEMTEEDKRKIEEVLEKMKEKAKLENIVRSLSEDAETN